MSGMDMMFKAMGLDPEAMQKSAQEFKGAVQRLSNDIETVKEQNIEILRTLSQMNTREIYQSATRELPLKVVDNG